MEARNFWVTTAGAGAAAASASALDSGAANGFALKATSERLRREAAAGAACVFSSATGTVSVTSLLSSMVLQPFSMLLRIGQVVR